MSQGIISQIEEANHKIRGASKALTDFIQVTKSPSWQAFDADLTVAKQVYTYIRTQLLAEANALPEVT